jgi:VanZ family protein
MAWLINHYIGMARTMAWIGILAIIILSVVPAENRPVTGAGQWLEHFTTFAIVGGAFAIGYRPSLTRLMFLAVFFCAGIELLQIPLPTRDARVSDFLVDTVGACFAILFRFCCSTNSKHQGAEYGPTPEIITASGHLLFRWPTRKSPNFVPSRSSLLMAISCGCRYSARGC